MTKSISTEGAIQPRAVILDFDGVVVDSLSAHLEAWDHATQRLFGRPLEDPERLRGHGTQAIAGIIARKYGDPTLASDLARTKQNLLSERASLIPLLPGARELLAECALMRLPYAIASNSPRAFVLPALQRLALEVATVITRNDVRKGKPHPDIFWEASNRLNIEAQDRPRILVFEDSAHGLKAATAAGMIPIGVTTEQTAKTLVGAGAVATCPDLATALRLGWLTCFTASEAAGKLI